MMIKLLVTLNNYLSLRLINRSHSCWKFLAYRHNTCRGDKSQFCQTADIYSYVDSSIQFCEWCTVCNNYYNYGYNVESYTEEEHSRDRKLWLLSTFYPFIELLILHHIMFVKTIKGALSLSCLCSHLRHTE